MPNFICKDCGKEKFVTRLRIITQDKQILYIDPSTKKQISCDYCLTHPLLSPVEPEGELNINFTSFSGKSLQDRQKMLKERSHQHFEKKVKEVKIEMNRTAEKSFFNK